MGGYPQGHCSITIQAHDRTQLVGDLQDIQYVDMKHGVDDPEAIARLSGALERQIAQARKRRPLWKPATPKPADEPTPTRTADAPEIETQTLRFKPPPETPDQPKAMIRTAWIGFAAIIIAAVITAAGLIDPGANAPSETPTQTPSNTTAPTLDMTDVVETGEASGHMTLTASVPTATPTHTPLLSADIENTAEAKVLASATASAIQATQRAATTTQEWIDSWTDTPTPTLSPEQIARTPVTANADWTPYEEDFNGVTMVLVPAGSFMMDSDAGHDDEQPVHEQHLDQPFWIDKYEVRNEQYDSIGCEDWSSEPEQPRNCVNWLEARDHCTVRNAAPACPLKLSGNTRRVGPMVSCILGKRV